MSGDRSWLQRLLGQRGPVAPAIDPDEFTDEVAARLRRAAPSTDVQVPTRFVLELDHGRRQLRLEPLWRAMCATDEAEHETSLRAFCDSALDPSALAGAGPDDVLPLLATPEWLAGLRSGAGVGPAPMVEALAEGLSLVYAVDSAHGVEVVDAGWFTGKAMPAAVLRARAVENLRGRLPGLEVQRGGGLNLVVAGGQYEAAVLLFDDFWARELPRLKGEAVVAMPSRDVLIYADSRSAGAVTELAAHARGIHADAAFALSPTLFVRHADGRLTPYSG